MMTNYKAFTVISLDRGRVDHYDNFNVVKNGMLVMPSRSANLEGPNLEMTFHVLHE